VNNSATADQRNAGLRAFSRNDFASAFSLLLPCAEQGDTHAQLLIARMYYAGNGVEKNETSYLYWLAKAAEGGDKSARARLKRLQKNHQQTAL
jgi:TPR repeat protein